MSGSEGSSTKQSTSRVSQGRLYGALEEGATRWFVTTADARIFYIHQKKRTNPRLCGNRRGFFDYDINHPLDRFCISFQSN